jgi:transposase
MQGRGTGRDDETEEAVMSSHEVVGIDVGAREFVVVSDSLPSPARYENTAAGHHDLIDALRRSPRPVRVVLEATGIYFLDLACALAAAEITVMVVNPKAAHHFAEAVLQRRKDDPVDAALLREFGRRMDVLPWSPPAPQRFALRALAREVDAQGQALTAVKCRRHALAATALAPAALLALLDRQIAEAEAAIEQLIALARQQIAADAELERLFARIDSVPGFGTKATVLSLAELAILPPMSARQWVAQAGLDVREERSGTSVQRRPRISRRGNARLRRALFYPALTAARCCPEAAAFVARLVARGKTRLQAIVALMRKLLHALHALWRNDEAFDAKKLFAPA